MQARTLVIVNPAAGGGRARRAQPLLAGYLRQHGLPADFIVSQSTEDLRQRASRAAAQGYGALVALGGDGAFHHLVEGAIGTGIVFGFFPAGNGNDIADGLGIAKDPIVAAEQFLKGSPRRVDVLRARFAGGRTVIYLGAGGLGLDAEAAQLVNERFRRWPGVTRYLAGALWALSRFHALELQAEMETPKGLQRWSGPALLAAVANAPCYGSGFRIAPAARMDDGWLDITVVGDLPWTRLVDALPVLLRTGDLRMAEIHRYRARRVALRADRPVLFQGDGELLGDAPVEIEVLPGAIRVVAPAPGE